MKRRVLVLFLCCVSGWGWPAALPAVEEHPAITRLTTRIQDEFGIRIIYREVPEEIHPAIVFSPPEPQDDGALVKYLILLQEELRRYPECFYQKIRLEAIVLVKRQFYDSRPLEGLYQRNTRIIVFDFLRNQEHVIKQRLNVHHELYHMFESQNGLAWRFRDWESMNVPGFAYHVPETLQPGGNPVNYFAPPVQGFVTYYAMKNQAEDRAEIFAALMIASQRRVVLRWIKNDPVLREKVNILRAEVIGLCPDMEGRL
ncbi:MAG TPA: putative zinc-binding metallopeptidase [Candidatus Omnitrophota bacterium]|jgi:hypothetical protein|nr:putative zinc-binding metallopeptidase [Candidatus Omnitrophota bacterium]HPN56699.1 putative zinc-binding metallopeptidase [Candidatus Omnitrophota bacterium]